MTFSVICRSLAAFFLLLGKCFCGELTTPRLAINAENTVKSTILTCTEKGSESPIVFRIDWISEHETPKDFKNRFDGKKLLKSTHLLGKTTLTRTVFASEVDDCIYIHVRANQPGSVNFTVRFVSEHPVKIADRRQLIFAGKASEARAWVLPFESDVRDDGKSITLAGEGEALIILNFTADPDSHPISETLIRLGEKYDPDHTPANPHFIWEGASEDGKEKPLK